MNKKAPLTIGYSTLGVRAKNIKFLDSVISVVAVQSPDEVLDLNFKNDISVIKLENSGVAKSRNAVINATKTDYLLFGDDDIEFNEAGIKSAVNYLDSNPGISVLLMQAVDESGKLRKSYPSKPHKLKLTNSAKAATYEMMVRVADINRAGIRFDENFGAGAQNYLGDEYIFIADAIRAGLRGSFLPLIIASHPSESSGSIRNLSKDRLARAKIFTRVFGIWAPAMRALFILKPPSKKFGVVNSLLFVIGK